MANLMDLFFRIGVDSSELDRALADASKKASSFGSAFKSGVGTVLGVGAKAVGVATAAVGAFAGTSVKAGSDFDKAMSQVAATMGVTKDDIGELTEFAQEMGRTTAFSASEAADAMNILAMAGYSAKDSMATLPSVLNMAAAGGLSIADAADYATGIMAGFSRETLDATTIADKLAVVASSAKGDVRSFGEGLNTVAGMANTTGQSMNDMTVALGILGNNNVAAAEAGNALSRTLKNLYQPTDSAAKAMKKLGVSSYDAEGNARPLQDVLIDLNSSMEGWSDEAKNQYLSQIFDAATLKTVPALLNNATNEWDELDKKLQNSKDAAENMAKVQLDNLPGDITKFKSALEGAQITISDGLTPTLRKFVQFGTKSVSSLTDAYKKGGTEGLMSALGGALSNGISMITGMLPDFINAGMSLLGALGQGIIDNLPQLVDAATQIVVQLANGLVKALPELAKGAITLIQSLKESFANNAGTLMQVGSELLSMLWQGVTEGLPMLTQGAVELMGNLATYLQNAIPQLLPVALNALMEFSGSLRENAGLLVDGALDLIMALADGLIASLPVMIETIPTIVSNIAGIINDNAPKLIATGIELIGSLVAGIIDAIPTLIAEFPKIVQAIFDVITAVNWISLGNTIINGIKNGVTNLAAQIPQKLSEIGQKAFDALKNVDWRNLGSTIINFIVNGIRGLITQIPNVLKSIGHNALSAMRNINWLGLGRNIIAGIASGITGAAGRIVDAAKSAAKKALNAAKNFLGIHSPSRVFREQIGKNISLGLAGGIENYADEVEDAAKSLAESATDPFKAFDEVSRYVIPDMPETAVLGASEGAQRISGSVLNEKLGRIIDLLQNIDLSGAGVYIDGRTLVGELVPAMDLAMGREASYKGRGVI